MPVAQDDLAEPTHFPRRPVVLGGLRDGNQALIDPMDIERKRRMFDAWCSWGSGVEVGFRGEQPDYDSSAS